MRRSSFFLAIFLIALGAILLLRNTTTAWKDVSVGPIILIALGVWLAFERGWSKHAWWGGGLIVPLILVALGVVLLLRDLDVLQRDSASDRWCSSPSGWRSSWPRSQRRRQRSRRRRSQCRWRTRPRLG